MELREILATKPEELALKQEKALAAHVAQRLKEIAKLIEAGRYGIASNFLSSSPAGDDHGCDNEFIDFSDTGLKTYNGSSPDLGTVLSHLTDLQKTALKEKK